MVVETYLYDILSVLPDATVDEISRSYKKMALKCHPDKTNHDPQLTEKFKEMTRAYEILKDKKSRNMYNTYGEAGINGSYEERNPPGRSRRYYQDVDTATDIFSQVFNDINSMFNSDTFGGGFSSFPQFPFGMGFQGSRTQNMKKHVQPAPGVVKEELRRGKDIHHVCRVSLDSLYSGKVVKFQLPKNSKCAACNGVGGFKPRLCRSCQGSGRVVVTLYNQFSQFQEVGTCRSCNGTGTYFSPEDRCYQCNGGYLKVKKIVLVNILPGMKQGDRIVLRGESDEGKNIIPGNLIITLEEITHEYLIRRNNDLYMEYELDLRTALLGGSIVLKNFLNGENLKLNINVHGITELNNSIDNHINNASVVGTINPGTPMLIKGFGMPVNPLVKDGVLVQEQNEAHLIEDESSERYARGDLFVKFNVKLPSISDFKDPKDLFTLNSILPLSDSDVLPEPFDKEVAVSNIPDFSNTKKSVKNARFSSDIDDDFDSTAHKKSRSDPLKRTYMELNLDDPEIEHIDSESMGDDDNSED